VASFPLLDFCVDVGRRRVFDLQSTLSLRKSPLTFSPLPFKVLILIYKGPAGDPSPAREIFEQGSFYLRSPVSAFTLPKFPRFSTKFRLMMIFPRPSLPRSASFFDFQKPQFFLSAVKGLPFPFSLITLYSVPPWPQPKMFSRQSE